MKGLLMKLFFGKPFGTACFNRLFGLGSNEQAYYVDRKATGRYGLDEEKLHKQGLWIDISIQP